MSLTKPPKKMMREYYLKPPAKGSTTAYICRQFYDRELKRTVQTLVASFNVATNPVKPEVNITVKGRAAGYREVPADHLAEVQRWLKKHGTYGKVRVPTRLLAQVRAEVEALVRAELNNPKSEHTPPGTRAAKELVSSVIPLPRTESAESKLLRLLHAIETACDEIVTLMPQSAQHFPKGHVFKDETVRQAQRIWFKSADAIAAMNGRQQLKRPKNWEPRRATAFGKAAGSPSE
jgi:hypothetical protein